MPDQTQNKITFEGLKQFLCRIGFEPLAKRNNSLAFQHGETGTLIMLSIPKDGRSVRAADLLSIWVRLGNQGLVDDAALSQMNSGKLPMAS